MSIKYKEVKYRTQINGTRNPLYTKFWDMKRRCYNPKTRNYSNYGGRGIKIEPYLQVWKNYVDYIHSILPKQKTIDDMQKLNWSIDRINSDGNYERGNLRWATVKQQILNRNTSKNNTTGYQGVVAVNKSKKWRAKIKVNYKTVSLGIFNNPEEAFDAYQKAYLKYNGTEEHAKMMERQRKHLEQR